MGPSRTPAPESPSGILLLQLLQGFYWVDEGLQNYLKARGWPAVTRPQSMVMASIVMGIVYPSEIARRLGVSRQAIHNTLKSMIDLDMISLVDDPENGRVKIVQLTSVGEAMRVDAQKALQIIQATLWERIGKRQVDLMADVLSQDWGAPLSFETSRPRRKR